MSPRVSLARLIAGEYLMCLGPQADRLPNILRDQGPHEEAELYEKSWNALKESAELDPADPEAATLLIDLARRRNLPPEEMETWYQRAMKANPANIAACKAKLAYLDSRPDADGQAMLAFGREFLATQDWEYRIPFILVDAHLKLALIMSTPRINTSRTRPPSAKSLPCSRNT